MKKKYIIVSAILVLLLAGGIYMTFGPEIKAKLTGKPKVVKDYLCSDVCSDADIKKYYNGVEDAQECKKIGGKPYTYYGWGEYHACLAE